MSEITSRIDNLLTLNSKKRADLFKATGLSEASMRNWIKGSIPSAEAAVKIARYFNVSVEWLITGTTPQNTNTEIILSEEERALIEIFRHLDDRDKNAVLTLAKSLEDQYSATLTKPSIVG